MSPQPLVSGFLQTMMNQPHCSAENTDLVRRRFVDGVVLRLRSVLPPQPGLVHSVAGRWHRLHNSDVNITEMEKREKGKVKKENDKNAMNVDTCCKHTYNPKEVDQFRSLLLPW